MSLYDGRMPVLATSVQEQLEIGTTSTEEVADEATQVNSKTVSSLLIWCLDDTLCCLQISVRTS